MDEPAHAIVSGGDDKGDETGGNVGNGWHFDGLQEK